MVKQTLSSSSHSSAMLASSDHSSSAGSLFSAMLPFSTKLPFLSVRWKAFSLLSLVGIASVIAFLYLFSSVTTEHFKLERAQTHNQSAELLSRLIESSAEDMISLASVTSSQSEFRQALLAKDGPRLEQIVGDLYWNLQLDVGVEGIQLLDRQNTVQSQTGAVINNGLSQSVLVSEAIQWQMDCQSVCLLNAAGPILHQGQVIGVLLISQPLSNVMLRFQETTEINTGLLSREKKSTESNESDLPRFIPSWGRNLEMITNPQSLKPVIKQMAESYSWQELNRHPHIIDVDGRVYEFRAEPLENRNLVVIEDITDEITSLREYKNTIVSLALVALIVGEVGLLLFLWRPFRAASPGTQLLPLVEEKRYQDVIQSLSQSSSQRFFEDETSVLKRTALCMAEDLRHKAEDLRQLEYDLSLRSHALATTAHRLDGLTQVHDLLLSSVDDCVLTLNDEYKIVEANSSVRRLLRLSSTQLVAHQFTDLFLSEQGGRWLKERLDDVLSGVISEFQHSTSMQDNAQTSVEIRWTHQALTDSASNRRCLLSIGQVLSH
ncbi:cache domain-containing protein [Litoribrevibacter albus]|uniref:Double Cache domain-containing protein n=1 Tax=Litoribrevibacter albus TaxID=1473156 RepID=A0AA37S742_9GAMM|nr:cache domain-containing protein [Litoribrevibacter albus]GLQ30352.1 hypothetical protein GCM10007876_08300 [Litoribrevibacter albus]